MFLLDYSFSQQIEHKTTSLSSLFLNKDPEFYNSERAEIFKNVFEKPYKFNEKKPIFSSFKFEDGLKALAKKQNATSLIQDINSPNKNVNIKTYKTIIDLYHPNKEIAYQKLFWKHAFFLPDKYKILFIENNLHHELLKGPDFSFFKKMNAYEMSQVLFNKLVKSRNKDKLKELYTLRSKELLREPQRIREFRLKNGLFGSHVFEPTNAYKAERQWKKNIPTHLRTQYPLDEHIQLEGHDYSTTHKACRKMDLDLRKAEKAKELLDTCQNIANKDLKSLSQEKFDNLYKSYSSHSNLFPSEIRNKIRARYAELNNPKLSELQTYNISEVISNINHLDTDKLEILIEDDKIKAVQGSAIIGTNEAFGQFMSINTINNPEAFKPFFQLGDTDQKIHADFSSYSDSTTQPPLLISEAHLQSFQKKDDKYFRNGFPLSIKSPALDKEFKFVINDAHIQSTKMPGNLLFKKGFLNSNSEDDHLYIRLRAKAHSEIDVQRKKSPNAIREIGELLSLVNEKEDPSSSAHQDLGIIDIKVAINMKTGQMVKTDINFNKEQDYQSVKDNSQRSKAFAEQYIRQKALLISNNLKKANEFTFGTSKEDYRKQIQEHLKSNKDLSNEEKENIARLASENLTTGSLGKRNIQHTNGESSGQELQLYSMKKEQTFREQIQNNPHLEEQAKQKETHDRGQLIDKIVKGCRAPLKQSRCTTEKDKIIKQYNCIALNYSKFKLGYPGDINIINNIKLDISNDKDEKSMKQDIVFEEFIDPSTKKGKKQIAKLFPGITIAVKENEFIHVCHDVNKNDPNNKLQISFFKKKEVKYNTRKKPYTIYKRPVNSKSSSFLNPKHKLRSSILVSDASQLTLNLGNTIFSTLLGKKLSESVEGGVGEIDKKIENIWVLGKPYKLTKNLLDGIIEGGASKIVFYPPNDKNNGRLKIVSGLKILELIRPKHSQDIPMDTFWLQNIEFKEKKPTSAKP